MNKCNLMETETEIELLTQMIDFLKTVQVGQRAELAAAAREERGSLLRRRRRLRAARRK